MTATAAGPEPEARVLVVDDEPNILELLSTSLRFVGLEVATARRRSSRRGVSAPT